MRLKSIGSPALLIHSTCHRHQSPAERAASRSRVADGCARSSAAHGFSTAYEAMVSGKAPATACLRYSSGYAERRLPRPLWRAPLVFSRHMYGLAGDSGGGPLQPSPASPSFESLPQTHTSCIHLAVGRHTRSSRIHEVSGRPPILPPNMQFFSANNGGQQPLRADPYRGHLPAKQIPLISTISRLD
jgi:hypothetical protein